jgi:hypothetical protein
MSGRMVDSAFAAGQWLDAQTSASKETFWTRLRKREDSMR